MANILAFYASIGGALSLALDYIEDGTHLPLPPHSKVWSGNSTSEGSSYISGKFENIPITLNLKVTGTSKTDLNDDLQAIITEITKENWLYFEPEGVGAGNGLYYHTFPYDSAEAHSYLSKPYRDAFIVHGFNITLMAEPYAYKAEQTITVVDNLCPNWSFEDLDAGAPVFEHWADTAAGAGTVISQDTTAGDFVFGVASLSLLTTAAGSSALILSDFIAVDRTINYYLCFNYQCEVGTLDALTLRLRQYDAGGAPVGVVLNVPITASATDIWVLEDVIGIIPGLFNAATTQVKLEFELTGAAANPTEYNVDGLVFTPSEYVSDYYANPLGIVIPPADIAGDAPAPCDIYISKFDDTVLNTMGIYVGGREEYNAGFVPYGVTDIAIGTTTASNIATRGSYQTMPITDGDLVIDGGFELFPGTSPSAPTFTNWTTVEDILAPTLCFIKASTDSKYGDYCLWSYVEDLTTTRTNTAITTAYIAVDPAPGSDYVLNFWYRLFQYSGYCRFIVYVREYSGAPGLVATQTIINRTVHKRDWTYVSVPIPAATWNAATTQVKLEFNMSGRGMDWRAEHSGNDAVYVDGVEFYESSAAMALTGSFDLDDIKGYVQPFAHLKLDAAQSSLGLSLIGKLTDGANDITPYEDITASENRTLPETWKYRDFGLEPFEIPNARISDGATTTGIDQEFQLSVTGLTTTPTTLSIDDLILLPVDNGYATIPAEDNQYLIIDSQSKIPGVLTSYDGTLSKAAWLSSASMSRRFTLDPQNGSNLAILEKFADSSGNEYGQFLADVSIKYKPRFLLAP